MCKKVTFGNKYVKTLTSFCIYKILFRNIDDFSRSNTISKFYRWTFEVADNQINWKNLKKAIENKVEEIKLSFDIIGMANCALNIPGKRIPVTICQTAKIDYKHHGTWAHKYEYDALDACI